MVESFHDYSNGGMLCIRFLLCCRSGLTTSKLVNSMKEEAASQNIDAIVWTVGQHALDSSCFDADCILVAPQNEFEYKKLNL